MSTPVIFIGESPPGKFFLMINVFSYHPRYASAVRCEVSLPQYANPNPACMGLRKAALAENQRTYTLKHDPAVHGFALLNMTAQELGAVALKDPFMRYFTTAYVGMTKASTSIFELYKNITAGKGEIKDISEYLEIEAFFQTALEPAVAVNINISFVNLLSVVVRCCHFCVEINFG